jgi:hypothetical protein
MRVVICLIAMSALIATAPLATAQQSQNKVEKSAARCTPQACQKRGAKKGFDAATATAWCAAHNNGC